MRSRILSLADCGGLITGPIIESMPISEITGNVERDLQSLCMQCKQTNAVSTVSSGDTVLLKLVSNLPRFHRNGLYVVVGANLFDTELEAALDTLDAAIESGGFTAAEADWAKLLRLYLVTPIDDRNELPRTPADMQ